MERRDFRKALGDLGDFFKRVKPRTIRLTSYLPPVIILTDAAAEDTGASLGAVLVDPAESLYEFFGKRISPDMVHHWRRTGKHQIICQAELVAVPVALPTWRAAITNRDVLFFIDNEPAREALVRGVSVSDDSSSYVTYCRLLCAEVGAAFWYARVASPSNIADAPSRGSFTELLSAGAVWRHPCAISCEPKLRLFDF